MTPPVGGREGGVTLPSPWRLSELATEYGGNLDAGCRDAVVRRVVAPEDAAHGDDLVLVTSPKGVSAAVASGGVLLVQRELAHRLPEGRRFGHPHALWVVAKLLDAVLDLAPSRDARPAAHVDVGAELHPSVVVRPGAVVLAGACVGERTIIGENAVVYGRVRIGAGTLIGPLAVIGRQGFGFTNGPNGEALRVPHVGGVIVEDEVEIGALATVDAGTLRPTVIRRGAKLDAHVHVAHNVEIGPGAYVAAQAGFAGSSRIGARVLVGGQAGVKDHAEVGDGARVGGKSGVIGDVAPGDVVAGFPAVPKARWLRAWAALLQEKKRTR